MLVEAGHRCAIPTCRQTPVEIHHIEPWAKVKEHVFENLIALCPTDHTRAEMKQIDRQALLTYKRNLGLLTDRYGTMERRLLDGFARKLGVRQVWVDGSMDFEFMYLLQDGLLVQTDRRVVMRVDGFTVGPAQYMLTDMGVDFVRRLSEGLLIEGS